MCIRDRLLSEPAMKVEESNKNSQVTPANTAQNEQQQQKSAMVQRFEQQQKVPNESSPQSRSSNILNKNFNPTKSINKRKGSFLTSNQQLIQKRPCMTRKDLYKFVTSKWFDYIIIILVFIYTLLVFIYFALDTRQYKDNDNIQKALDIEQIIEMTILSIFQLEIVLKVIAFGFKNFIKDRWQLFDALVISISIIILALDMNLENKSFKTISKVVRGIFRFLRLFLVFRKITQFQKISNTGSKYKVQSPIEKILEIFKCLKENLDDSVYIAKMDWCTEIVTSEDKLYQIQLEGDNADAEPWISNLIEKTQKSKKKKKKKKKKKPYILLLYTHNKNKTKKYQNNQ
eukprot:TRINITY_DN8606_c0_g1_i4.p1 TRINITY_DN8606_c0_g1~~TRINITY_DN8606_c0_g1_i4.p1  ORF type:complete len:344 (+),score=54.80 TRINITY_DN8606_c0_g1_i4:161-1192(+)